MSYTPPLSLDLSPVRLSYVAALRGVVPRKAGNSFAYAQTGLFEVEDLLCLAASNPDGKFYGLMPDEPSSVEASMAAKRRQVWNVSFGSSLSILPDKLDYLCGANIPDEKKEDFFSLAENRLKEGGLLAYRYPSYANPDESLRFLIAEYAPELSDSQAKEFLAEIKKLGSAYFTDHPIARAALDKAIAAQEPSLFFEACGSEAPCPSGAFDTMAALLPRGFAFAGDADVGANYLEIAAPPEAHEVLIKAKDHLLYEPVKDFALQRLVRNDVWVKLPAEQSADKPTLFGLFTFGITTPREKIPSALPTKGASIDLSSSLFSSLIDLMCVLPMGIGDFLQHPTGKGFDPDDILAAVQILVAGGIARPMRGRYEGLLSADIAYPLWSNGFNAYLKEYPITESSVLLASPIVGGAVSLSAREALVLQALSRVGLANVSGALQPELETLARKNPALAAQIMDAVTPTDEIVHNLVTESLQKGMVRWYAYGLLAA